MFNKEALGGDITKLANSDISLLIRNVSDVKERNLYIGNINDPDMFKITQAIYIVLWGDIYDLTFDKLGPWGKKKYPFRGDTMNSFNTVYGKEMLIAKRYKLDDALMESIVAYQSLYHSIGNFIVIPNRMNVNSKRSNYYSMQDYFDSFIGAIYQYKNQNVETEYSSFFKELKDCFAKNPEYEHLSFERIIRKFYLDNYVKNGQPYNVFNISYDLRKKEYVGRNRRSKTKFISDEEYLIIARNYSEKATTIIQYRGEKICEKLKKCINEI